MFNNQRYNKTDLLNVFVYCTFFLFLFALLRMKWPNSFNSKNVLIIISYFYFTVLETIPLLYLHTHKQ